MVSKVSGLEGSEGLWRTRCGSHAGPRSCLLGVASCGWRCCAEGMCMWEKKTGKCPYSALRICFVSRDAFSHAACFRLVSFDDAAAAVRRTVFWHVTVATRLARGALRRRAAVCSCARAFRRVCWDSWSYAGTSAALAGLLLSNVSRLTAAPQTRRQSCGGFRWPCDSGTISLRCAVAN